jgi:hypothetical protein
MESMPLFEFRLKSKDWLPYLKIIYASIYGPPKKSVALGNTGLVQNDIKGMIKPWYGQNFRRGKWIGIIKT